MDLSNAVNAAMATPVPKGVGAVTTSVLAEHLVIAAKTNLKINKLRYEKIS